MSRGLPRVLTVLGARPQFVKAAALCHALRALEAERGPLLRHSILHTGQHFDREMSAAFFDELGIDRPEVNLEVRESGHGAMTGRMLAGVERELLQRPADAVLVYGDTNSTLAGALAAAKLHVPVVHVEAGLRSFDRRMPEELNRVLTDHISTLLFAPTRAAVDNLAAEGISDGVHLVGDVMLDAVRLFADIAAGRDAGPDEAGPLARGGYVLATCHRAENVDDPQRLGRIFDGLGRIAAELPVVLPLHPRTRARLETAGIATPAGIRLIKPVGYLRSLGLLGAAAALVTDSGGMQKEAYILGVPCVTLRPSTEWVETLEDRANALADADPALISGLTLDRSWWRRGDPQARYGRGDAARLMVERVLELLR